LSQNAEVIVRVGSWSLSAKPYRAGKQFMLNKLHNEKPASDIKWKYFATQIRMQNI